ncbi:hypothetical protein EYZ11_013057 [Aspergillus tanneri]|uniref:Uncharacterized protein n=1 Tax=Aspergillus tanneri TaxID=1220188 RepID=A0A4S3J0T5_9EURO|nr:uncharacterized protein ATNIH1004_006332 [Aspergillus tanneri]KAA8647638.1 hypothetical protein ATNIH1004_006332 [Aspergillus tanneri]THC87498.1 hypothetical protein EYZ11_013057 [Aspergillus tanneri]
MSAEDFHRQIQNIHRRHQRTHERLQRSLREIHQQMRVVLQQQRDLREQIVNVIYQLPRGNWERIEQGLDQMGDQLGDLWAIDLRVQGLVHEEEEIRRQMRAWGFSAIAEDEQEWNNVGWIYNYRPTTVMELYNRMLSWLGGHLRWLD